MIDFWSLVAGTLVVVFGLFFLALTGVVIWRPELARRFLLAFASSSRVHFLEQALRLLLGGALVVYSPEMAWPEVFRWIGWIIVGTSVALIVLPWRWHQRFAQTVLPTVVRFLGLYGVGVFGFGVLLLFGVFSAVM